MCYMLYSVICHKYEYKYTYLHKYIHTYIRHITRHMMHVIKLYIVRYMFTIHVTHIMYMLCVIYVW